MKITAAVLRQADGDYRLEQVDLVAPGTGEALVRIVGAGMCHTDVLPRSPGSFSPPLSGDVVKPVLLPPS